MKVTENNNFAASIDFSILQVEFRATYQKVKNGYTILLLPSDCEAGKQEKINVLTLGEQIAKLTGNKEDGQSVKDEIAKALTERGEETKDVDKLQIYLSMAFLYIVNDGETTKTEYAFQLLMETTDIMPESIKDYISLDRVSLSVWNTNNKKVLRDMALSTLEELRK